MPLLAGTTLSPKSSTTHIRSTRVPISLSTEFNSCSSNNQPATTQRAPVSMHGTRHRIHLLEIPHSVARVLPAGRPSAVSDPKPRGFFCLLLPALLLHRLPPFLLTRDLLPLLLLLRLLREPSLRPIQLDNVRVDLIPILRDCEPLVVR